MSLEYERPDESNEPESLQNIKINYIHRNIKSMYPKKLIISTLDKHMQIFDFLVCECVYQLDYKCKDKCLGNATIYQNPLNTSHKRIRELEKDGYKFHKIAKLTISTYNSIRNFNPLFYRSHIPKSMFINKILQLIDKDINNFKHWGCDFNCLNVPWKCLNTNPVTRFVCYKLYS